MEDLWRILPVLAFAIATATPALAQTAAEPAPQSSGAQASPQPDSAAQRHLFAQVDRFEFHRQQNGADLLVWDAEGWYGSDRNRFWFKTDGTYSYARQSYDDAELQFLYSHAITRYFDLQAGLRQDPAPSVKSYGALALHGFAPDRFELDASVFFGEDGLTLGYFEAEYEIFLTEKLVLQPRIQLNLRSRSDPAAGQGSGLTMGEAGLRLRYQISRQIAPYIGVSWQKDFGQTADFARSYGENTANASLVAGLKLLY